MVTLSTRDNPYDPFNQYDEWNAFDMRKGYNTNSYLARIARTSPDIAPADYEQEIERAVDEILKYDFGNMYVKIEYKAPEGG